MAKSWLVAVLALSSLTWNLGCTQQPGPGTRPFYMGFTGWPSDASLEGFQTAAEFVQAHADIVSVMMIGGLPWPEAFAGSEFSKNVRDAINYRPPAGKKLFVSISPLNDFRTGMAPYWGEHDNLPLPPDWANLTLNDPKVKKAFLAFCIRVADAMHPDYLAIGVEDNVLLSKDPTKWSQLKELHRETYTALKKRYPKLHVFFTTDVGHYLRFAKEAKDKDQAGEVGELMRSSDLFAMSFYPYGNIPFDSAVAPGFLDFARKFGKPIAVSESGMTSRDVTIKTFNLTLRGTEDQQKRFASFLLDFAARDRYEFVINFATTDFEKLAAKLPLPTGDLALIWAYTGLQRSDKTPKPALSVWDEWFRRRYLKPRAGRAASLSADTGRRT
ncbi:MAG: hypothetical protein ACHQ50_10120 [Fimbriimonadales bacterium]